MKPFPISDLPPALQAQARAQLEKTTRVSSPDLLAVMSEIAAPGRTPPPAPAKPKAPARIRQNGAGLNKTEAAFYEHLLGKTAVLPPQSLTLKIANGCRYTPDFITVEHFPFKLHAYEVKGFMRDDAAVKIKVAAALFPWISFHLVTRAKGGTWEILPVLA